MKNERVRIRTVRALKQTDQTVFQRVF